MTWFKVDDGFYDHPKFLELPNAAVGLWVKAGAWCGKHLTDGVIPASKVKSMKGTKSQISALIEAHLWVEVESELGAKAYRFRDWNDYQPTRKEKLKERADSAERQRKSRDRKRQDQEQRENVTRDSQNIVTRDSHGCHNHLSQRPDPTRPDPTTKEEQTPLPLDHPSGGRVLELIPAMEVEPSGTPSTYPLAFEKWWELYPRKTGKGGALKAWRKAAKAKGEQPLLDATRERMPALKALEKRFQPHPSTWLNDARYDDPIEQTATARPLTDPKVQGYAEAAARLRARQNQELS